MKRLEVEVVEGTTIVKIEERQLVDELVIQEISEELTEIVRQISEDQTSEDHGRLILEFSHVEFMSSAMLRELILLDHRCRTSHVRFKLRNLSDNLMEVFRITHVDSRFEFD